VTGTALGPPQQPAGSGLPGIVGVLGGEPPGLLREKAANGEIGRKAGRGFYEW
jgi:hypothetical protein